MAGNDLNQDQDLFSCDIDQVMKQFWAEAGPAMADYPRPSSGRIYHYTDISSAISIIESQELWSSNIAFLNDFNELICAQNIMKNLVNEKNRVSSDEMARSVVLKLMNDIDSGFLYATFVFSFCPDGDLLSQWRGYGSSGVAIGFDVEQFGDLFSDTMLVKVIYNAQTQMEIFDSLITSVSGWLLSIKDNPTYEILEKDVMNTLRIYFENIAAKMKNYTFREENEWRLVTRIEGATSPGLLRYRVRGNAVVPYIEIKPTGKLPIVDIILAPNSHPSVGPSLQSLLWKKGYPSATVTRSLIPFRD